MKRRNENDATVGSKTGVIHRIRMDYDGSDRNVNRTGVFRREDHTAPNDKSTDGHREPPAPPSLPEVNEDEGGTTGLVDFDSEGKDSARREDHPRQ